MKKKILFVMPNLDKNGVSNAFLNLINEIKNDQNLEISVFLFNGDNKDCLPDNVNVMCASSITRLLATPQKQADKESRFLSVIRLIFGAITRLFANHYAFSLAFLSEKELKGYDVAISFCESARQHKLFGGTNEFVLTKVEAEKKVTVLHCDYKESGLDTLYNCDLYQLFDNVCTTSAGVGDAFASRVPECRDKVCLMHNCLDFCKMAEFSAIHTLMYERNVLNILTVAKLEKEKGHMRILDVLYRLKEDGFKFCWHVVGDGKERAKLEARIDDYNLSRNVILYGEQKNPYKFYPNADVLLVPSYFEAASMVFGESEFFNLPIVATKTTSTEEFVTDKNLGIVCENSENGIYQAFLYIFKNPHIIKRIRNFVRQVPDNEGALSEFYKIIEGDIEK